MSELKVDQEQFEKLIKVLTRIADAIAPNAVPYQDAYGGTVSSVTEALISCSCGLTDNGKIMLGIEQTLMEKLEDIENSISKK